MPEPALRLLILGLSNLVRRRVLPALHDLPGLEGIDIGSRQGLQGWEQPEWLAGQTYPDYDAALERSSAEVVYVSLVNSEHSRWARAALEAGRHVMVDKPAFLSLDETERTLDLAAKRNLCLAEATVWAYHPQIAFLKHIFAEADSEPTRISVGFSIPPMDPGNFRYCRSLGGGCLWDLGPYAVSVGRVFFRDAPETIDGQILSSGGEDNVETAFSMLASYPRGRSMIGHFGFDTAYRNHLDILSASIVVEADRAFTIPADAANEIRVTGAQGTELRKTTVANAFRPFFEAVFQAVEKQEWRTFRDDLLADARALQRLRDAAGVV